MKNSKVLSLLTAGALVVSSFSGLAMNGGVAKAANTTTATFAGNVTPMAIVAPAGKVGGSVYLYSTANGLAAGDATVTFGAAAAAKLATAKPNTFVATAIGAANTTLDGSDGQVNTNVTTGTTVADFLVAQNTEAVRYLQFGAAAAAAVADVGTDTIIFTAGPIFANGGAATVGTVTPRGKAELAISNSIVKALGATQSDYEWELSSTDTTKIKMTQTSDTSIRLDLQAGALSGETYVVTLSYLKGGAAGATKVTLGTYTLVVGDEVAKTVSSMTVTEYNTNTKTTNVNIQFGDTDIEQNVDFSKVVVGVDTVINSDNNTITWSNENATAKGDPVYAWRVKSIKVDDNAAITNPTETQYSDYFTMTNSTKNNSKQFALGAKVTNAAAGTVQKQVVAEIEVTVEGYAGVVNAIASAADWYKGTTTFTLTCLPQRVITSWASTSGVQPFEAGSGEVLKIQINHELLRAGRFPAGSLYYQWDVVNAKVIADAADETTTHAADEYKTAADNLYDDIKKLTDGANMFELDGAEDHQDTIKVKAMSTASAGTYWILCRIYGNEAQRKVNVSNRIVADKATKNAKGEFTAFSGYVLIPVTVVGDGLTVKLDSSKIGTDGLVKLPGDAGKFEKVVSVKSTAGTDLTATASVIAVNYAHYMATLSTYGSDAQAYSHLTKADGITFDKGTMTITNKAVGGAYVAVAKDSNLGIVGVSSDTFMVKTGSGKDVTGLELSNTVVELNNQNDETDVYAKVLPVKYYENGYNRVEEDSAEVTDVIVESSDESVVVAKFTGHGQPVGKTNHYYGNTTGITLIGKGEGNAKVTVTTVDGGFSQVINVAVKNSSQSEEPTPEPEPEPEHKAGDAFTVDGVSVFVNADGKTLTVTDVTVVGKTATIPATVDGMDVTAIAAQAFKKSDAKTIYVKAAVTDIEKGAFKKAKTKKIFFYEPAALNTVAKNAFKGANVKVVGVGGSFSESAASQLKKAGASKVKNNGTAK